MIYMNVTIDEETDSAKNVDVSDKNSEEVDHEEEATQGVVEKPLRRSTQSRKV